MLSLGIMSSAIACDVSEKAPVMRAWLAMTVDMVASTTMKYIGAKAMMWAVSGANICVSSSGKLIVGTRLKNTLPLMTGWPLSKYAPWPT